MSTLLKDWPLAADEEWRAMHAGEDRPLSVKKAAERAGVSASLVYAWCHERRLPHYRAGGAGKRGRILIAPADLDAFVRTLRRERHPLLAADE